MALGNAGETSPGLVDYLMVGAFRFRKLLAAATALLFLAVSGCSSGNSPSSHSKLSPSPTTNPLMVRVAGRLLPASGITDVATALRAAGVALPDGRLLSVVTKRVLNAHANRSTIFLNGSVAALSTPVRGGDAITFVAGHDSIEATRIAHVAVPLDPKAAALYLSTKPGFATIVEGAVSAEQVSSLLTRASAIGKLRSRASVSVTFDDGPNGSFTSNMLSLLSSHHVQAVFCDVGARARAEPQLVRRQLTDGHRLCDHTQTHPLNLPRLSPARIATEIDDGYRSIVASDGGVRPIYFRAPGGNWSATVENDAKAYRLKLLRWTVDPRDWSLPGTATIVQRILEQLRPGGIVLMHDGGGDRSESVAALAILLDQLTAAGWTFTFPR